MTLNLNGYDIDCADEVEVILNDVSLGYLETTANNGYGASQFSISTMDQLSGANELVFHQTRDATFIWGVDEIQLVSDDPLT